MSIIFRVKLSIISDVSTDLGLEPEERTIIVPEKMLWIVNRAWECIRVACAKNNDYSAGIEWYENFKILGVVGIYSRMMDKVSRLKNLLKAPNWKGAVKSESLEDICMDLYTYGMLLAQAIEEGLPMFGEFQDCVDSGIETEKLDSTSDL